MKKSMIINFIDSLAMFTLIFILAFVLIGYAAKGSVATVAAALTASLAVTAILLNRGKSKKNAIDSGIKAVLDQFTYNDESFHYKTVKNALAKRYNVTDKKKFLLVNGTAVFVELYPDKLTSSRLSRLYGTARTKADRIVILTQSGATIDAIKLTDTLPKPRIDVFDGEKTYKLLKWLDSLPEVKVVVKKEKSRFGDVIKAALSPPRARHYFTTALLLIVWSLVFPRSIYYIVAASVLIALGVMSLIDVVERVRGRKKKPS